MTNINLPNKIDLSRSILWQYNKATRIQDFLKALEESGEMCSADVWSNIPILLNIKYEIKEEDNLNLREIGLVMISQLFGIDRPIIEGVDKVTELEIFRRFIIGRIYLMDSDCSASDINEYLRITMPEITSFVIDQYDMTITYALPENFDTDYPILSHLTQVKDFFPRPAGVLIGVIEPLNEKDFELAFQKYQDAEETQETHPSIIMSEGLNTFNNSTFKKEN